MQNEIQKQLRMMPGQEKMLQEYYQSNPAVLGNLRGQLYEEKILKEIKSKAKSNVKEISKEQAEKLLKEENDKHMKDIWNEITEWSEGEKPFSIARVIQTWRSAPRSSGAGMIVGEGMEVAGSVSVMLYLAQASSHAQVMLLLARPDAGSGT